MRKAPEDSQNSADEYAFEKAMSNSKIVRGYFKQLSYLPGFQDLQMRIQ